ncbi:MAG TPA: DUF2442 domain-containing protein [Coleofasciculaceae cyanobacterium]|jgi:hypothetical protein
MLKDIVKAQPLDGYQLHLKFEDDVEGIVDIAKLIEFTGVFEPLGDLSYFAKVIVNSDLGTICWDNGADLDPDVLYALVSQESLPDYTQVAV